MKQRLKVWEHLPKAFEIMLSMEKFISTSDISFEHRQLIKIRASQINHCAYCLDMHIKEALKEGVSAQKINLIAAWNESPLFSESERALLKFTEEITLISKAGVNEGTFKEMQKHYTDTQISQIIVIINQINSWNRVAVSTCQPHPID